MAIQEAKQNNIPVRRFQDTAIGPYEQDAWLRPWSSASPWNLMRRLEQDVDRLFGRFVGGTQPFVPLGASLPAAWVPTADLSETKDEWQLEIDLPGFNQNEVNLQIRNQSLYLRVESRRESQAEEGRQYHRRERRYGLIEETFPLPSGVVEDRIRAEFRNGVLICHLPKSEQAKSETRQIPISGA